MCAANIKEPLIQERKPGSAYENDLPGYQSHLLDQYRLYIEMADKISDRRQNANSYFLSVNTAVLAFVGYITTQPSGEYLWLLALAGVVICYLWYRLVRSYRDLNGAKFRVAHLLEKSLPARPYDYEWIELGEGHSPDLYKPVSHIEMGVPWVFMGLHLYVFAHTVPLKLFCTL